MQPTYKTFTAGQKVISNYGERFTVLFQDGCKVFVKELSNAHAHPSNLRLA